MNPDTPMLNEKPESPDVSANDLAGIQLESAGERRRTQAERTMSAITIGLFIGAVGAGITWLTPLWVDLLLAFAVPTLACVISAYCIKREQGLHGVLIGALHALFGGLFLTLLFALKVLDLAQAPAAVVGLCAGIYLGTRAGASIAEHLLAKA